MLKGGYALELRIPLTDLLRVFPGRTPVIQAGNQALGVLFRDCNGEVAVPAADIEDAFSPGMRSHEFVNKALVLPAGVRKAVACQREDERDVAEGARG